MEINLKQLFNVIQSSTYYQEKVYAEIYNVFRENSVVGGLDTEWVADSSNLKDYKNLIDLYGADKAYELYKEDAFYLVGSNFDTPMFCVPSKLLEHLGSELVEDVIKNPITYEKYISVETMVFLQMHASPNINSLDDPKCISWNRIYLIQEFTIEMFDKYKDHQGDFQAMLDTAIELADEYKMWYDKTDYYTFAFYETMETFMKYKERYIKSQKWYYE